MFNGVINIRVSKPKSKRTECNFDGCKLGLHPFKAVTSFAIGIDEEKVVRWCPECGAIVVDCDYDGRTNPGYFREMEYPKITKKYGLE